MDQQFDEEKSGGLNEIHNIWNNHEAEISQTRAAASMAAQTLIQVESTSQF